MAKELIKCHIVNVRALGQGCGFGEGKTWEEARADAVELANLYYPGKVINAELGGVVQIDMECNL